jgi:hypothetical protein
MDLDRECGERFGAPPITEPCSIAGLRLPPAIANRRSILMTLIILIRLKHKQSFAATQLRDAARSAGNAAQIGIAKISSLVN